LSLIAKDNATAVQIEQALSHFLPYSACVKHQSFKNALVPTFVFLFLAIPQLSRAQTPGASTTLLNLTRAIAANQKTGKVYAVATKENAVLVFLADGSVISRIAVGNSPAAIAINAANDRIYVANSESGTISVLDGTTDSVITTLTVGPNPYVLAADSRSNKIYVSNTFSDQLTIIDGATNSLGKLKAGSADAIAIDEELGKVYLLGYEDEYLKVLDEKSLAISTIKIGIHQWGIAIDSATHAVYVTRSGNSELAVINPFSGGVSMIATGETPCAIALNGATNTLYVVNHTGDSLTVVNLAKLAVITNVKVGRRPQGIAIDAIHNRVYVANRNENSIAVIDGVVNRNPFALAVLPDQGKIIAVGIEGVSVLPIAQK
jgi:YVTN family beta-propeller protein